jgi:alkylation response protein AidB-like acyl-CoA dehydrogenase
VALLSKTAAHLRAFVDESQKHHYLPRLWAGENAGE